MPRSSANRPTPPDVDEAIRAGEAKLHEGQQALAAGNDLRVGPVYVQELQCIRKGRRALIGERGRDHEPARMAAAPARTESTIDW